MEGPSALRLIERYSGAKPAVLRTNRRQIDPDYKAIVNDIRSDETRPAHALTEDGKTTYLERALNKLDEKGWIIELPKGELYKQAAKDYLDGITEIHKGKQSTGLMLTTTHKEADGLTDDIRGRLREIDVLRGPDHTVKTLVKLDWSPPERATAINYEPGQVVQFNRDAKGIKWGERFTVVERKGESVTVARKNGGAHRFTAGACGSIRGLPRAGKTVRGGRFGEADKERPYETNAPQRGNHPKQNRKWRCV